MNIYDFDKTIYPKDSSIQFYVYNLVRHPKLIKYWPSQLLAYSRYYLFGSITKTEMKTIFYRYFKSIPNIHEMVNEFWDKNERNIHPWYLQQKKDDDLIISASPEFLLKPICEKLGITLIASRIDEKNGNTNGNNCYGEEKVNRFYEIFPEGKIDSFYSDSYSDTPLALLAYEAFLVKGSRRLPWDNTQALKQKSK